MIIDLSEAEVFDSDELDFDKKVTFIFGKNGTGKSTLTEELKKISSEYDVSTFQGFLNIIDENKRLNAVVLGEENSTISRQIEAKKAEIVVKNAEVEAIRENLQKPEDALISNFWTKKENAVKDFEAAKKRMSDFYTKSASKIKSIDNPRLATLSYNKRNFQEDILNATILADDELKQYIATIKSEVKDVPLIIFPKINFQGLVAEVNAILGKSVIERVKISRLENDAEKREFAKKGYHLHRKGEVCAFCGSEIKDTTWDELESYFSADEVKSFQIEIENKITEIDLLAEQIGVLEIDSSQFYPAYISEAKEIGQTLVNKKKEMLSFLKILRTGLDNKLKYMFEKRPEISERYLHDFRDIKESYNNLRKKNNENDLTKKQQEAIDKVRKHYVKKCLDDFGYDAAQVELNTLENSKRLRLEEYDAEERKITGVGGLNEVIKAIQDEIIVLQNDTKNEIILAENINKKLKHMVSFELVHVEDDESKGFYRVKNSLTGYEREITELSTGEKNVIAFLYFIEKLDEIKETPSEKPRVIVFDDPMSSNDDGMQYLIIEELQKLMKRLRKTDHFILLTHNKHFYINVKYRRSYNKDKFIRFQSDGNRTHFVFINNENDDYKTSYESLWSELKLLYGMDTVSADLLLNPIRRIIETFTKFNAIDNGEFCSKVKGAMKLFNVNSHSIDDVEAELNGKTKNEIVQMFYDCFAYNQKSEHFRKFWSELEIGADGKICFSN